MTADPLDRIPSFARVSVAAVLVTGGQDPASALADAGITDAIAVEVRFGETLDPSQGLFGDGRTPNPVAVLEETGGQALAMAVVPSSPAQFGTRPVAPVRVRR